MSAASLKRELERLRGKGRGKNGALSCSQMKKLLKTHGLDAGMRDKHGQKLKPTERARRAVEE